MLASSSCSDRNEWQANQNTRVCTDANGNRVEEGRCQQSDGGYNPYRWYYISHGGYIPYYGGPVGGGFYSAPAGTQGSYSTAPSSPPAGSVTRGGFGSIGSSHAGGGEGGGGGE